MVIKAKIKKLVKEIDKHLPRSIFYVFIMSPKEKVLFDSRIKNSKVYLEFGMGGSTFRVLQKSKAKVYSIDSSVDWLKRMREFREIRLAELKNRLSLFLVDIGPTGEWGKPVNDDHKEKFPSYSSEVFNLIVKENIDTVLIDGRFRVACTLKTIWECHKNKNFQIIIHDFWNREEYQVVLKHLDSIDQAESLGVFRIKNNVNLDLIEKEYEHYKYIID